ncbi:hypothetical protein T492DRAFT_48392 [Pavlovales sp. CCMP2436]|nr:hypothetical protein T492DRAFT_48392 [Pavlovales sp. CCMP2436]
MFTLFVSGMLGRWRRALRRSEGQRSGQVALTFRCLRLFRRLSSLLANLANISLANNTWAAKALHALSARAALRHAHEWGQAEATRAPPPLRTALRTWRAATAAAAAASVSKEAAAESDANESANASVERVVAAAVRASSVSRRRMAIGQWRVHVRGQWREAGGNNTRGQSKSGQLRRSSADPPFLLTAATALAPFADASLAARRARRWLHSASWASSADWPARD